MLKKRLVGVVTVREGGAVLSFGYRRYLPLGRPEFIVENLDRWGADEIVVLCIDRSKSKTGPDLALLHRLAALGLSTPLVYGGGIASVADGVQAISAGADRIALDSLLHDAPEVVADLGRQLGVQALVGSVPLRGHSGAVYWHDYRKRSDVALSTLAAALERAPVSELLLVDCEHEGQDRAFQTGLLDALPGALPVMPLGGISSARQIAALLDHPRVAAVCVGNSLNYRELALQGLKQAAASPTLRPAHYACLPDRKMP